MQLTTHDLHQALHVLLDERDSAFHVFPSIQGGILPSEQCKHCVETFDDDLNFKVCPALILRLLSTQ